MTALNVKYNNDKSRDYTRSDLPSGEGPDGGSALQTVLAGQYFLSFFSVFSMKILCLLYLCTYCASD